MGNGFGLLCFLGSFIAALPLPIQSYQTPAVLSGVVQDETNQAIAGVEITLRSAEMIRHTLTNDVGRFHFDDVPPGSYVLNFDKGGFFRLSDHAVTTTSAPTEIVVTLNHEYEMHSRVDVVSTPHEVVPEQTGHQEELVAQEIRENPVPSSHTLQNALPALSGVVQDSNGLLHIAGNRAGETLYVLDGFQVNSPPNALLEARVDVDAVRSVDVATGRFGSQFANAGSAVLALQTDMGNDHWRFGITNFLPTFIFSRGTHLSNWFPRATVSGPIHKGRIWFSDALSLQHGFTLVRELPPGADTSEDWSGDNLLRLQYNVTPSQSLQGNFLYNASTATRIGLGPFAPASTTTDLHARRYLLSAKDQVSIPRGLLEVGISYDADRRDRFPQGSESFVLTPTGPQGNYFERMFQDSSRWQSFSNLTLTARQWHGVHTIQSGFNLDRTHMEQTAERHSVEIRQSDSTRVRNSSFLGYGQWSVSELQAGGYVQDSWQMLRSVILQSSLRIDRNDFVGEILPQPRFVLNWIPREDTKFSVGWGVYYQPIYLSVIGLGHDQQRVDFLPGVSSTLLTTSFSHGMPAHQPYFQTTSAEWQQQWSVHTTTSIHFMTRRQQNGLVYENVSAPSSIRNLQLGDGRHDQYRSIEVSLRRSIRDGGELMIAYTYSQARSNRIFDYSLEDFVLTPQASGPLTWDTPHRLISRGAIQTKIWNLLFSYFAEYHTGFPFSAVDSQYQRVGVPNGFRYPSYFSVNVGVEKRFPFRGYYWAVRVSAINLTGHNNYNSVVNNIDAPNFLTFAGGQARAFTARLRFVGRK